MALVTEQQVRAVRKPIYIVETPTFRPLEHSVVLDSIETALNKAGLEIARDDSGNEKRRYTLVDENAKLYATLPLTDRIDNDSGLMLGIVNSWNKSLALRIGFGSRVFVCENGAFFAEKVVGRKHTPNIMRDLPDLLAAALQQTNTYVEQQRRFFERLRTIMLTDNEAHDLIVRGAIDHDAITGGEIVHVVSEWREPRYDEFKPRTAWSLHNAFTEVAKRVQGTNGVLHAERMVRLSGFFADIFASDLQLGASRRTVEVVTE
jgi:hypothetical protein